MGAAWRRLKQPFLIRITPFLGPSPLGALVGRSAGEFRLKKAVFNQDCAVSGSEPCWCSGGTLGCGGALGGNFRS